MMNITEHLSIDGVNPCTATRHYSRFKSILLTDQITDNGNKVCA